MANICGNGALLCAARFASLDGSGYVVSGASKAYVIQPIDATVTWEYEDGAKITQKGGCGDVCFKYETDRQLVGGKLRLTFCELNPGLEGLIDGGNVITSGGNDIGYFNRAMNLSPPNPVAVELFGILRSGRQAHGSFPAVRAGFPLVRNWTRQDLKFDGDSPWLPSFEGDIEPNPNYANGAFNDWPENWVNEVLYGWHYISAIPETACTPVTVIAQSGS